ncbi:MAG: ATP-grasp domain-containing protein [Chitinophagaceae bacterium]|nr:MAG: ATP-grasp domain-containing protein [Chitinophagaceae bacterium]
MTPIPQGIFPAILFQSAPAPATDGIMKPMKENGYADSGADVGFALQQAGLKMVCPVAEPHISIDREWVFPDNAAGISHALNKGANVIWLNTVLYKDHPIEDFLRKGVAVVGQDPRSVQQFDDKWLTSEMLQSAGIPVPAKTKLFAGGPAAAPFSFPFVVKPIRGRGSQGVYLVRNQEQFEQTLGTLFAGGLYGSAVYAEPFLSGEEITVTVMPPGTYYIFDEEVTKADHWCLTAVKRFNHQDGVAPYNGVVPIVENSRVISAREQESNAIQTVYGHCAKAAALTNARAPVRIDCRQDEAGTYQLFDLNMKPNMTGPSRPHRYDQDSLVALAAADLGWNYTDLLINILNQHWRKGE